MSKSKPGKVFAVATVSGVLVIVLARHAKGAVTTAKAHGYELKSRKPSEIVTSIDPGMACRAINAPTKRRSL